MAGQLRFDVNPAVVLAEQFTKQLLAAEEARSGMSALTKQLGKVLVGVTDDQYRVVLHFEDGASVAIEPKAPDYRLESEEGKVAQMKSRELKLGKLWLAQAAAEARSSSHWTAHFDGNEQYSVYSASLGLLRVVVPVVDATSQEFAEYIAAFDPGATRHLLDIAGAAERFVRLTKAGDTGESGPALEALAKALEGVTATT